MELVRLWVWAEEWAGGREERVLGHPCTQHNICHVQDLQATSLHSLQEEDDSALQHNPGCRVFFRGRVEQGKEGALIHIDQSHMGCLWYS